MSTDLEAVDQSSAPRAPERSRWSLPLLAAGILGRTWLWFVGGCIAISLVPILLGWRPYVIESGSMQPRIDIGDVILAAPTSEGVDLVGRVAVFTNPDRPDQLKTHRIVAVNPDGTLVTKGDANPTNDSVPLEPAQVRGLGRLLVAFAGLPLIWAQSGQWLLLALFGLSILLAGMVVSRDRDEDDEDDDHDDGRDGGELVGLPMPSRGNGSSAIAAARPLDSWLRRTAYVALLACSLTVPGVGASLAATTKNTASSWSVPNWNYGTTITALSPWLYWKLDETTGTSAADGSGSGRVGTYNPNAAAFTRGIVGALTSDTPNLAVTLNGTTSCINTTSTTSMVAPAQLTEIVWFKTATTNGGKLFGFETPRTGVAVAGSGGTYDRHLYMDGNGKVWFGVYNGGFFTVGSPTNLNDNTWHMAAATLGTGGMTLYIDGLPVGSSTNAAAETTNGWFRAGCGNLAGWGASWGGANNPTTSSSVVQNRQFAGSLDEISVWQSVLSAATIRQIYISK